MRPAVGWISWVLVAAGCLSDEPVPERAVVGLTPVPPANVDRPSVLGSATVKIVRLDGGRECSGTLITPTVVLTAAHCVVLPGLGFTVRADPAPGFMVPQASEVVGCFVHPSALSGMAVTSCADLPPAAAPTTYRSDLDIALLEVESAFVGITPRSLEPPRSCIAATPGPTLLLRGYDTRAERRRARVTGRAPAGTLNLELAGVGVEDGDSGGTVEEADRDGSVIGVIHTSTQAAFLWELAVPRTLGVPSAVDWIWSVIDPGGDCDARALDEPTIPCIPRGFTTPLPDADDDGLPDARDLCPDSRTQAPGAMLEGGNHRDSDRDWRGDDCDACPTGCDFDDPDGDGVCTTLDACPLIHSRLTVANRDGDQFPDACDLCPDDPPTTEFSMPCFPTHCDTDGDRRGDECDNCNTNPNPLQENCNEDAEEVAGVPPVGDACDSTPCGETRLESRTVPGDGVTVLSVTDDVHVDARVVPLVPSFAPLEGQTGMRFCRCSAATGDTLRLRQTCRADQGDDTGACGVSNLADYRRAPEGRSWFYTSMTYAVPRARDIVVAEASQLEAIIPYRPPEDAFRTTMTARWDLAADATRWAIPTAPTIPGVLWTHTSRSRRRAFTDEERQLPSHYWSGPVDRGRPIRTVLPPSECLDAFAPALIPEPPCLACATSLPGPWLARIRDVLGCPSPIPPTPTLRWPQGLMDAETLFVPGAGEAMVEPGGIWIAAAEPDGWLPDTGVRYVQMTTDGSTALRRIAALDDGRLGPPGFQLPGQDPWIPPADPAFPPDDPAFPPGDPALPPGDPAFPLSAATSVASLSGPAPRSDFAAVLSGRRELLWIVGGRAGDELLEDAWILDLRAATWRRIALPSSPRPGRVLAATYAPAIDSLLVLDEVDEGSGRRRARLLQIDALGREASVLATWRRISPNTRFALATDRGGALFIAASGPPPVHVVLRARLGATGPDLTGFRIGTGALASGAIRASGRGVTLLVRRPTDAAPAPVGYATDQLLPAGRDGWSRCF